MSWPPKPEDLIDQYFVFKKTDLAQALLKGSITLTAADHESILNALQDEIGKKYFVLDTNDPLVATLIVTYIKLMYAEDRLKEKVKTKVRQNPKRRLDDVK